MLKDILAISGEPGLYKLVSRNAKGVIIENLDTKKRMPYYNATKISSLEDIAIFTEDDDKPLNEILQAIKDKENSGPAIDHKSAKDELIAYFKEVVPDYDEDRVYASHIKKIINWYNILQKHDLMDFESKEEKEEDKNSDKEETSKE
ncbi:MAG: hypothetical protein C0599_10130 [Salinivirgaceae bacterium]|nr:MAG: hypothetical protein C0599_10130 [Salinivirgaceae bacterium]